jgi:molybdopterin/thiamine biosynthesis adenylyltransferase
MTGLAARKVLMVGAGGLGSAAGRVLARSGVGQIDVLDDDRVDSSNLHRQTLYRSGQEGQPKASLALAALRNEARNAGHSLGGVAREVRLLPDSARELVGGYDLVLEGADNFATKFLAADACALARVPLVQGGAVRWVGWALASLPGRSACLRCVFEDIPREQPDTCASSGVVGPVVGVVGALQAALALRLLTGDASAAGELWSYRGLDGTLRSSYPKRVPGCALCNGEIRDTARSRYLPPNCAA